MKFDSGSIGDALSEAGYRPTGFDYLRTALSFLVVLSHAPIISSGAELADRMWNGPLEGFLKLILPMFFALSGFLVAGSMERCRSVVSFAGLRLIRIYPALTVEVLISALIIGPAVTTVGLASYFQDPIFFRYLVNITGHITYFLPGVFESNPFPHVVNGQLWTVKWELICYVILIAMMLVGAKRSSGVVAMGLLLFLAVCVADDFHDGNYEFRSVGAHVHGKILVLNFIAGVLLYQFRARLPKSFSLGVGCLVLSYVFLKYVPGGDYFSILPAAYLTIYIGILNSPGVWITKLANTSYGVFLYGFSVQQFVAYEIGGYHPWWLNAALSLPLSILVGFLSWHLVEAPIMKRRKVVFQMEDTILRGVPGWIRRNLLRWS